MPLEECPCLRLAARGHSGGPPRRYNHKLHLYPEAYPVKQKTRSKSIEKWVVVFEDVDKLTRVNFMREVHHIEWLANVILVNKVFGILTSPTLKCLPKGFLPSLKDELGGGQLDRAPAVELHRCLLGVQSDLDGRGYHLFHYKEGPLLLQSDVLGFEECQGNVLEVGEQDVWGAN